MPWNKDKTKFEGSPTELLMGAEAAQDALPGSYIPYDYEHYMLDTQLLSAESLSTHIASAILGKNPEWLLTIRKVIRDRIIQHHAEIDRDYIMQLQTLLTVIAQFIKQMNILTLT